MAIDPADFKQTRAGINYIEMPDSGALKWATYGVVGGERKFIVPWEDRIDFVQEKIGHTEEIAGETQWVDAEGFPGYEGMRAKTASAVGYGKAGDDGERNSISFAYATVVIGYDIPQFSLDMGSDLAAESIDFSGEFLRLPKQGFKWKNADGAGLPANEPLEESPGVIVPSQDLILEQARVPTLPRALIRDRIGKVNGAVFREEAIGTVLYLGASARRSTSATGALPYAIVHRFKVRTPGWNYAKRPGKTTYGGWAEVTPPPYAFADFSTLVPATVPGG